jgi:hypothetical protein
MYVSLRMDQLPTELRRAPRIAVDLPVRYRSETVWMDGRAGNLSQDGMFFVTPFLDDPEEEIVLELDLPEQEGTILLAGKVCWVDDAPLHAGMGIRFVNVALRERLLLANFLIRRTCPV